MGKKTIVFSLEEKFATFTCKLCEMEFLIFSIVRGEEFQEEDSISGPMIRRIYCPFCAEEN